jgi:hypothetical protein
MDAIARGWVIFWSHMHGHSAVWIAILIPVGIAIWFATWSVRGGKDEDTLDLRPKRRDKLPGPDRGFR